MEDKTEVRSVNLTDAAIEMVKRAIEEEDLAGHGLRIAVFGGGCSGLNYSMDFENTERPGDEVYELKGLKVYVDMASVHYLRGTTIDYITGEHGSGFRFDNPNAQQHSCCSHSCGSEGSCCSHKE